MEKVIVRHFQYKGNAFVIVRNGEWFMAIPKEFIDENGILTKTVHGGYRTIEELIRTEKMRIDYQELLEKGVEMMEALQQVTAQYF